MLSHPRPYLANLPPEQTSHVCLAPSRGTCCLLCLDLPPRTLTASVHSRAQASAWSTNAPESVPPWSYPLANILAPDREPLQGKGCVYHLCIPALGSEPVPSAQEL